MTIGELSRRAGVSESTLRAWERRYGVLRPARTSGGHRRYGPADLAAVERLLAHVAAGLTVAAAAERIRAGEGGGATVDAAAVATAHRTALRLLHLRRADEVGPVLVELVLALGGDIVSAADAEGDPDAVPLDLSFGIGVPILPLAPTGTRARARIEALLPELVEAGRSLLELLRSDTVLVEEAPRIGY